MSWGGSEKNRWFQLDVLISMLWSSSGVSCTLMLHAALVLMMQISFGMHASVSCLYSALGSCYRRNALYNNLLLILGYKCILLHKVLFLYCIV